MTEPSPVVLAVAKDADMTSALTYAAAEALRRNAELILVHVFQFLPVDMRDVDETTLDLRHAEYMASEVLRVAHERAEQLVDNRVNVTSRLIQGSVVQELVDASVDAALVVLQRRDLSRLTRVLTRSTSSGIAARAHAPVAVVPTSWPGDSHQVVTVGIDALDRGDELLRRALEEARLRGATLRVQHALWFAGGYDDVILEHATDERRHADARRALEAVLAEVQGDDDVGAEVKAEIDVRHERPGDMLVAASRGSDLVVIGQHDGLVPVGSHLGPIARGVLRESASPVLVVAPTRSHRR